jgi:hypothetical protein
MDGGYESARSRRSTKVAAKKIGPGLTGIAGDDGQRGLAAGQMPSNDDWAHDINRPYVCATTRRHSVHNTLYTGDKERNEHDD